MLTFAAPFAPASALRTDPAAAAGFHAGSPEAGAHQTYWPCELLNAFALKMAANGHCVNMSMMLGHHPYALEQLALARDVRDADLLRLVERLQTYFHAPVEGQDGQIAGAQVSTQTLLRPWPLAS